MSDDLSYKDCVFQRCGNLPAFKPRRRCDGALPRPLVSSGLLSLPPAHAEPHAEAHAVAFSPAFPSPVAPSARTPLPTFEEEAPPRRMPTRPSIQSEKPSWVPSALAGQPTMICAPKPRCQVRGRFPDRRRKMSEGDPRRMRPRPRTSEDIVDQVPSRNLAPRSLPGRRPVLGPALPRADSPRRRLRLFLP